MALRVGTPGLGFETERITLGPLVSASTESGKQPPPFLFLTVDRDHGLPHSAATQKLPCVPSYPAEMERAKNAHPLTLLQLGL